MSLVRFPGPPRTYLLYLTRFEFSEHTLNSPYQCMGLSWFIRMFITVEACCSWSCAFCIFLFQSCTSNSMQIGKVRIDWLHCKHRFMLSKKCYIKDAEGSIAVSTPCAAPHGRSQCPSATTGSSPVRQSCLHRMTSRNGTA